MRTVRNLKRNTDDTQMDEEPKHDDSKSKYILEENEKMKKKLNCYEDIKNKTFDNKERLSKLYDRGIFDSDVEIKK